jgi:phosphoglycolate phosphatase-like HAD superfamily hydrolase
MQKCGLLIFDLDGTLFQAHKVTVPATQRSFQALGLPAPPADEICSFFGKPVSAFNAWVRTLALPESADEIINSVARLELELVEQAGELYPQVRQVLTTLRATASLMAICTNGPREYVQRVLKAHDLAGFFDAVRYREIENENKTLMARELLARLPARPAIVIGDRGDDVQAAHQNGLQAIAATYGYGASHELQPADAAAASPADLPALVQKLLGKDKGPGTRDEQPPAENVV